MASSLCVLCIEPLLINLSKELLQVKTSLFVDDPLTVLSAYADDTGVFISAESQLPIIDCEFNNFGKYSGASLTLAGSASLDFSMTADANKCKRKKTH